MQVATDERFAAHSAFVIARPAAWRRSFRPELLSLFSPTPVRVRRHLDCSAVVLGWLLIPYAYSGERDRPLRSIVTDFRADRNWRSR